MEDKGFMENRGPGFERLPTPDNGREGYSGKLEEIVGALMGKEEEPVAGVTDFDERMNEIKNIKK